MSSSTRATLPDALYVVLRGRVAIANKSFDGRESVVALMENGDLFGEMGMLDGLPRSAEARALEPSEVLELGYEPARALLERRPELLWGVVRMLADRLRGMDEALADSVFLDVTGRTAKRLLELASGADEFLLPVTQEELAGMVGASRERVNKAIASFTSIVRKGSIAVDGISLTVAGVDDRRFDVQIIPYTWEHTNLRMLRVGEAVNLECDILGKYVFRALEVAAHTRVGGS